MIPFTSQRAAVAFIACLCLAGPRLAHAAPLDARPLVVAEFFASNDILNRDKDWYSNGLDDFAQSWETKYIVSGGFGNELGRISVTGARSADVENTSYELSFRGEFADAAAVTGFGGSWSGNLISHNAAKQTGEIIPPEWQSADGYKTPAALSVSFNREYSVVKRTFQVGEFNCPAVVPGTPHKTDHCEFEETWFAGSVDLAGQLKDVGDISAFILGQESVTETAKADRKTRFKVNGDTLAMLADIQNPETKFQLDDSGQLKEVKLSWEATLSNTTKKLTTAGDSKWEAKAEHADIDASYNVNADMLKFVSAGGPMKYLVQILDSPDLLAGINGNAFTSALVFASMSARQMEELHKVVAIAVPVAEPGTALILATGLLMLARRRRGFRTPPTGARFKHACPAPMA